MTQPICAATAYAEDVVAGRIVAGPQVRDACKRHLLDLAHGHERGLTFDQAAAQRAIGFAKDVLRLSGGDHQGKAFLLQPWQAFVVGSVFGWKSADGTRRFRFAFILTAKGSGKTPTLGLFALYCLMADNEPSAEVYVAASKREQAAIAFRDIVSMIKQSPALTSRLKFSGGPGQEWNVAHLASNSFIRVVSSEGGQSGTRPHCLILDEVHEMFSGELLETLRAGTKGRRQALVVAATNAESDRTSICAQYREYSAKVNAGTVPDDAHFAYVASLDDEDDPFKDRKCWIKANPSLGVTIQDRYLDEQVTTAAGMPAKAGIVLRLNFCRPTDAFAPWIDRDLWDGAQAEFDPADLVGVPCYGGLDLSSKRDLTALALAWKHPDGRLNAATWCWTPGDTLEDRARSDNVPYPAWRDAGHLLAPPGRTIDKEHVARFVQQLLGTGQDLQALAFDQAQVEDFLRACDNIGLEAWIDDRDADEVAEWKKPAGVGLRMRRHGQGFTGFNSTHVLWMPRSIGELEDRILKQTINIRSSPVLTWNSASAVLQTDPSGNRKFEKRKSTGRIDGLVALAMAVGAATSEVAVPDLFGFLSNPVGF